MEGTARVSFPRLITNATQASRFSRSIGFLKISPILTVAEASVANNKIAIQAVG